MRRQIHTGRSFRDRTCTRKKKFQILVVLFAESHQNISLQEQDNTVPVGKQTLINQ